MIRAGFVEMIPSALVFFLIKSTATSFPLRPLTRSIWTMATFPWAFNSSTIRQMLQTSPNRINTIFISSRSQHFFAPSISFTAAITGFASR